MIIDSEGICKCNTSHLTAITCLTEDELKMLGSRDSAGSNLSDDNKFEWVSQESYILFLELLTFLELQLLLLSNYYYLI